ncbi:TPA: hypothetical protein OT849_004398 [Enterobacter cloacae]|nr:hypothetical protein [Enterobacter cloacae]
MKAAHLAACWFVCSTVAGDLLIDITTVDNPHKQMAGTTYLIDATPDTVMNNKNYRDGFVPISG